MWQKPGQATFFEVLARLLKEKAVTDAFVAALKNDRDKRVELVATLESNADAFEMLGAVLRARNAELANPAGALSRKRTGTTSEKKPWRKLVLADEEFKSRVLDPAVERAKLARRIENWLENQGEHHPQAQAIDRWIAKLRKPAAAQAR
jgi:hypothetical protein